MNHMETAPGPYPASTHDSDYDMSDDDSDPTKPWLAEFKHYLMTHDVVPEGMLIVEWWGVHLYKKKTFLMIDSGLLILVFLVELWLLSCVGFPCS